ncbi:MAG TPA: Stk1 family PASTA domain-containing Ser/Thr kinase [Gaiellaceae bacterium]|jgi:beta-lactam-binding protein with PASTA domain/predicted Ser/Thr protein kinase|nr:Stk1 family PASTA domain-containing Ser/Thr kinase [Gaiellaceae bacterium]
MATQDTLTGTLFAGRYRVTRKLGGGGMANVYLAEDQELGRRVAIKILHDRYANDDQFVERFRREATHAAGLSHPNIVSIYDRGTTDGSYFIVMEYVEGVTLKELIRSRGPCPIPVAIAYTRQLLAALRYAHRHGVVHRDIKPHNVIVDPEGVVKVTDFGIARAGASQMTEEGAIIGTAQYLSPEQARGAPVDQTSDLYSAGIVLYELLTGEVPFTGETPVEIAMKHLAEVPEPPSARRPDIPADLDAIVLRALAKEPAERYPSAAAMDADLETVARGGRVPEETADAATVVLAGGRDADAATAVTRVARREVPPLPPPPPRGRSRALWPWLLGVGAVLALLAGGWFLYDTVQRQLEEAKPVAVPYVVGLQQAPAENLIEQKGLVPQVRRVPSSDVEEGVVISQNPTEGTRVDKDTVVLIDVSSGKPEVTVPSVVGQSQVDAVEELTRAGLDVQIVEVFSDRDPGTVTAQSLAPGTVVVEGTRVRINVSKGEKPVTVPNVVGIPYDEAAAELRRLGFVPVRSDGDSDLARGIVFAQEPDGGSSASKGSTVTLSVSRGPATVAVPEVSGQDVTVAQATLEAEGFRARVVFEDTDDPTLDGVVISQDPVGGAQARPGSVVRLFVGRFTAPPPTTPVP